jgi:glycosyltransferase involved in cell wall biosynthesis
MATHFNGSHADEMVESGLIRVGGGFYQSIQADERRALLHTDRLVFVSRFMRDVLRSTVPRLKERPALVVPNFIEIPAAPPDEKFAGDLASIGTLEPRKNQVFLLHVLAAARQKGFRYTLTLFGAGAPESSWRRVAQDLGIADQVVFAGFVPQASRYLHRFRAYVHGSKIESFGISLVEALACGLPVFAARAGGMPEVIDEGVTGFFWDLGSAEDAADMLIRVLEDEPLLESMSRGARAAYSTRFSADRIAPRLEAWVTRGIDLGDPSSAASITWSALASDQRERFNLAGNGHRER